MGRRIGCRRRWTSKRYRLTRGLVIANAVLMKVPLRKSAHPTGSGQVFERAAARKALVDRMPVPDPCLPPAPAEADDLPPRHRVEVDEAELEIADDAAVVGHLGERLPETVEAGCVNLLLLPKRADIGARPARTGALDGREHLQLAAQAGQLAPQGAQLGERRLQKWNQAVRLLDREDLVPDPLHGRP